MFQITWVVIYVRVRSNDLGHCIYNVNKILLHNLIIESKDMTNFTINPSCEFIFQYISTKTLPNISFNLCLLNIKTCYCHCLSAI